MAANPATTLPLLERVGEHGTTYVLTPRRPGPGEVSPPAAVEPVNRMPVRKPGPGEQYRFHVDMGTCIGCKCCVVACNEQNGNPASINWRRIGELEGGFYPDAARSFLSMGCNHCLEPTCLEGCPVDAYSKDAVTGIVLHSADACIGCQYCTWNCAYGVPQFNPERGVVGKCDMCHGRLSQGDAPACVAACPTAAIRIEIVNTQDWRARVSSGVPTTGAPVADGSGSTTRVTLPAKVPPNLRPVSLVQLGLEDAHWPLVVMTVLTQLSVGGFATVWLLQVLGGVMGLDVAAGAALLVSAIALNASTLHLGRPIHAYRAVKMWRRSWLSREVLLFAAFSAVACLYAATLWWEIALGVFVGGLTVALGLGGVTASAQIYRVTSRPSWNSPATLAQFNLTAAVLGPLFAAALGVGDPKWLSLAAAISAGAQLLVLAVRFIQLSAADSVELRASGRLLATLCAPALLARGVLLAVGAVVLPLVSPTSLVLSIGLALAVASEFIGRYLFFVTAVPRHMTAPYLGSGEAA